ncbi:MAG: HAD hydrolase-like protein [Methylococcaceae bacterium]|nr:HAD hydrolase-like protein [Methylococcaceae bacterium]
MKIPAFLIFDLDGTISDPSIGIGRSLNYALSAFDYPILAEQEVSQYIGPPLDQTFRLLTQSTSQTHVQDLVNKYRERYADVGFAENVLYPGIAEALASLAAQGMPLGLCTSKPLKFAERILTLFELREYFSVTSGGDVGIQKTQQLRALLNGGAVGAASTMIGDRAVDIQAAVANGFRSVGVLWGHGSQAELTAAEPNLLLHSPEQLMYLGQRNGG